MTVWQHLMQGDGLSRLVVLVLLLMSVATWVVVVWKTWMLRTAGPSVALSVAAFWQSASVADASLRVQGADVAQLVTPLLHAATDTLSSTASPTLGHLAPAEQRQYAAAVETGNWMAMRQAAFASGAGASKLERLVELCDEAAATGRKVVVFSYFLGVLELASQVLGTRAIGPLTGALAPERRQELIDEFTAAPDDAVLVAQVQAGGVGLNIQAASVVILCEPQLKPSTEAQAIARVHRMGQVQVVDVHRLLAADSVDERIMELLADKQRIFDDYARDSVVAGASDAAIDPSQPSIAALVIETERARLRAAS